MNIILISNRVENPIDDQHVFVCIGPNCWGKGRTAKEAHQNAKANAPYAYRGMYITKVAPIDVTVCDIDGALLWDDKHPKDCKVCSAGKGISVIKE